MRVVSRLMGLLKVCGGIGSAICDEEVCTSIYYASDVEPVSRVKT